jgi:nitroreductase
MNETIRVIQNRRSVRAYADRPIERDVVDLIVQSAMRAPTAGNMMLYSIIEIADQSIKDKLAVSCDHQPFLAKAPLVLLFLADYQRWFDFYMVSDVQSYCDAAGKELRYPGEGDLLLACCDALIAAQTAVIAAESLGIGSCYIGDIMEQYEYHRELLDLPQYAFPIAMLCFGYPKVAEPTKDLQPRLPQQAILYQDRYPHDTAVELDVLWGQRIPQQFLPHATNMGQHTYARKFGADFSVELTRSVQAAIRAWATQAQGEHE